MLLTAVTLMGFMLGCTAVQQHQYRASPALDEFCSSGEGACVGEPVRVGAWNLQRFGITKVGRADVLAIIVKVIQRYDLLVLQEVTDISGVAVTSLKDAVNMELDDEDQYDVIESPRTGRTSYKEQYAFFYKRSRFSYVSSYKYPDDADVFQVEPFIVLFNSTAMGALHQMMVIPLHAKPSDAVAEIDALVDVYDNALSVFNVEDAIILGDFNAGCSFVIQGEYELIRLYTDPRFLWLISDHADTTTRATSCPYDRIVVAGALLQDAVYPTTAEGDYFDEDFDIEEDWELVKGVSDHYPVELLIRGTVPATLTAAVGAAPPVGHGVSLSVTVDVVVDCWTPVMTMLYNLKEEANGSCTSGGNETLGLNHFQMAAMSNIFFLEWEEDGADAAVALLLRLSQQNPLVVTSEAVAVLGYKLVNGALDDPSIYAPVTNYSSVHVSVFCRPHAPPTAALCSVALTAPTRIN